MDHPLTGSATATYTGVHIHQPIGGGGHAHVVLPPTTVESTVFAAAGHYWSARFLCHRVYGGSPWVSMTLHLWSRGVRVRASWELSVVDPIRGSLLPTTLYTAPPRDFVSSAGEGICWDFDYVYLSDRCYWYVDDGGRLVLQITVTVLPENDDQPADDAPSTTIGKQLMTIDDDVPLPPSDMLDQLGEVFRTMEGADVTFSVDGGELVPAHRIVLAMRSRVFKALLYGKMKEDGTAQPIEITDMTADTFRALLCYIYTDSSPATATAMASSQRGEQVDEGCHQEDNDDDKQVWELLKAADRFSVERLKLICERVLCKRLDVDNVVDMLGLADRHHCATLKDACIEFMTTSQRMGQVKKTQGLESKSFPLPSFGGSVGEVKQVLKTSFSRSKHHLSDKKEWRDYYIC